MVALGVAAPPHLVQAVLAPHLEMAAGRGRGGRVVGADRRAAEHAAHGVGERVHRQCEVFRLTGPAAAGTGRRCGHQADPCVVGRVRSRFGTPLAGRVADQPVPLDLRSTGVDLPDRVRRAVRRRLGRSAGHRGGDAHRMRAGDAVRGGEDAVRVIEDAALDGRAAHDPAAVQTGRARSGAAGSRGDHESACVEANADRVGLSGTRSANGGSLLLTGQAEHGDVEGDRGAGWQQVGDGAADHGHQRRGIRRRRECVVFLQRRHWMQLLLVPGRIPTAVGGRSTDGRSGR